MAQSISNENIKYFRDLIAKVEPYPLEVLNDLMFDDTRYDDQRILATYAKKRLLECGIPLTTEQTV